MAVKKTISFKKMIEKEAELYWLTFGEVNAIIDAAIESCAEGLMDKLYETKCVNCYRGIVNATLLCEAFEIIPNELPEDWTSEINSEQFSGLADVCKTLRLSTRL